MRAENTYRLRDTFVSAATEISDVVAIGAGSLQTIAVPSFITDVRVCCSVAAWIAIGANPTATAGDGSHLMGAGQPEYFRVTPGQKIAVIQDGAGTGNMSASFVTR